MSEDLITDIYNAFDPFRPLEPGDPVYVDCQQVRGDENVFRELGKKIIRSHQPTCQLYTGHRGVGKSTELKRLKAFLEEKGCFVVYFAADQEDIDPEDAQYTDILLACTRHILEELKNQASPKPLLDWLKGRWQELKDLALTEVSLDSLAIETQIAQFAKLTANLRTVPSTRQKIREQIDIHTKSLIDALNQFIGEAKAKLKDSKLVVIADNLDRIVPVARADGRNNHDEIFLDRCGQLRALQCHVIYTVPISMVYSNRATLVRDNYGDCQVLPMIMVRTLDGSVSEAGLSKLTELIGKRIVQFAPEASLDTDIFDGSKIIKRLCLASGGHVREVMQLMQTALDWTDDLPICDNAVQRAMTNARNNYRNAVDAEDWEKLAEVSASQRIPNDLDYRNLLFNRCLLEYRYVDSKGEIQRWHDAHPLIKDIEEFREAIGKIK
ncbi:MAG TPA: ATP-binding protein [Chroococcales cyanobacterium]